MLKPSPENNTQNKSEQSIYDHFVKENLPSIDDWPDLIGLEDFDFPGSLNCATELLDRAIDEGYGHKVAIVTAERSWTYQQVLEHTNQVANYLMNELGVIPGNRVLLYSYNNVMAVCCWLAIVKLGGVVVAALPSCGIEKLVSIVHRAQACVALCDSRLEEDLKKVKRKSGTLHTIKTLSASPMSDPDVLAQSDTFTNAHTAADDACLIAFTSGTTGEPKAAVHFHRDILVASRVAGKEVFRGSEEDVFVGTPSLAFGFGLGSLLFCPFYCRATSVLIEKPTPLGLLRAIEQYRASLVFTSVSYYEQMGKHSREYDLSSLRLCVPGGEEILPSIWKAWKERTGLSLFQGIGSSEMLYLYIGTVQEDLPPGCVGKPIPGYEATVMDHEGKELPVNQVGQLAVKGPIGCRYLNDKRQKDFVVNGWNVTDDLFHKDEAGYFWFHGRVDNRIITDTVAVIATEVEEVLLRHDWVAECAVVGAPGKQQNSTVKAYIVLEKSAGTLESDNIKNQLERHAQSSLTPQQCPRLYEIVDNLPRTTSGKIQRYKLRQLANGESQGKC